MRIFVSLVLILVTFSAVAFAEDFKVAYTDSYGLQWSRYQGDKPGFYTTFRNCNDDFYDKTDTCTHQVITAVTSPAAAQCQKIGGRLPKGDELLRLVREFDHEEGPTNGTYKGIYPVMTYKGIQQFQSKFGKLPCHPEIRNGCQFWGGDTYSGYWGPHSRVDTLYFTGAHNGWDEGNVLSNHSLRTKHNWLICVR